jgi:[acyl-carrier-protein] S-malonyltransferase
MGADLATARIEAKRTFEEADDVLGVVLSRVCWGGPEEELRATENAQPALLTHSVAVARVLAAERMACGWFGRVGRRWPPLGARSLARWPL